MSQDDKTRWLSQSVESLLLRLDEPEIEGTHCDVLIVGSGYGGAVAAARMAGSMIDGRRARIWLLERGEEHLPGRFPSRFAELAGHVRFSRQDGAAPRGSELGLFDVRIGPDVSALVANGLGGGSLINAGVMERPEAAVFETGWPAGVTSDTMEPHYATALAMLGAAPLPANMDLVKLRNLDAITAGQTFKRCAVTVQWQTAGNSAAGVPLNPCTLCGDCMTGCNQGAKGSLDTSYLAWARARGVEMFCGAAVEFIQRDEQANLWQVNWHHTERARRDMSPGPFIIRASQVVLAAGTLGSTEILKRSEFRGLNLSPTLGQKFSMNGDALAAGFDHGQPVRSTADQETDPADPTARYVGPTITGMARVLPDDGGAPFTIEEFAVPAALRQVFGEVVKTLAAMRSKDSSGTDPSACTDEDIRRMSLYGLMGNDLADGEGGSLTLSPSSADSAIEAGLRIEWAGAAKLPLFRSSARWLAKVLQDGDPDDETVPPVAVALPVLGLGWPDLAITVHPLGGCRMADSRADGVVDSAGRVFKPGTGTYPGLAVLDGSIIPGALGINPALTIAALAERAVPTLMVDWTLNGSVKQLPPRPLTRRRELPPADVSWALRERMQGPWVLPSGVFWAVMEIEFEEIPGFTRALQLPDRVIGVRRGRLELHRPALNGQGQPIGPAHAESICGSAALSGSLHLFAPWLAETPAGPGDLPDPRVTLDYRLSVHSPILLMRQVGVILWVRLAVRPTERRAR